jgi:hypothetical protein
MEFVAKEIQWHLEQLSDRQSAMILPILLNNPKHA